MEMYVKFEMSVKTTIDEIEGDVTKSEIYDCKQYISFDGINWLYDESERSKMQIEELLNSAGALNLMNEIIQEEN